MCAVQNPAEGIEVDKQLGLKINVFLTFSKWCKNISHVDLGFACCRVKVTE